MGRWFLLAMTVAFLAAPAWAAVYTDATAAYTQSSTTTNDTTHACNKPTGTAEGDLLVAYVSRHPIAGGTITAPAGWTQLGEVDAGSGHVGHVYTKTAGGSEGSSYTWTTSIATYTVIGIIRVTGQNGASPVNDWASAVVAFPGANPTVTTTVDDCLELSFHAKEGADALTSTPAGMTVLFNSASGSAGSRAAVAMATQASAGASTARTWQVGVATRDGANFTVAIAPAGGGPSTSVPVLMHHYRGMRR